MCGMVGCQWGKHMSDRKEKTNCNTTLKELKYGWMDGIRVIWNWMLDISVFWNTCNINVFCQLLILWPNYLQASLPPSCLCWTCAPSIDQVCRWPCAQLELSVSSSCSLGWPLVRPLPPCRAPMLIRERRVGNVCLACTLFVPLDHWSDHPNY